jgi:hypothetical protein
MARKIKPTLQLREGAWYERKDGQIVGPCERCEEGTTILTDGRAKWRIGVLWYSEDGTCPMESNWLMREVEPPKPKYRAFTCSELDALRGKWITFESGGGINEMQITWIKKYPNGLYSINSYGDEFLFENAKFIEDGSPFGVLDDGT